VDKAAVFGSWLGDNPSDECFLLSLESLGDGWNRPEEDLAWAYLQFERLDINRATTS